MLYSTNKEFVSSFCFDCSNLLVRRVKQSRPPESGWELEKFTPPDTARLGTCHNPAGLSHWFALSLSENTLSFLHPFLKNSWGSESMQLIWNRGGRKVMPDILWEDGGPCSGIRRPLRDGVSYPFLIDNGNP